MVRKRLPGEIYRLKGFVQAVEDPEHRYVLHAVGRRSETRRFDAWGDQVPSTRLVAMGASGGIDRAWLDSALAYCTPATSTTPR